MDLIWLTNSSIVWQGSTVDIHNLPDSLEEPPTTAENSPATYVTLYVNMAADWRSKNNSVNNRNVVSLRQNKVAPVLEGDAVFIQVTNR